MDGVPDNSERLGLGELLRADRAANRGNAKGLVVVTSFRLAAAARGHGRRRWWALPVLVLHRLLVDWIMGVELPPSVVAGPGLRVWHGTGLVVHANSRLGADVTLRHNTTLGAKGEQHDAPAPVLGDRVDVGAGAIVLGALHVGDDAVIGAGAVVVDDVPAGATVVGNPARVLPR
jgi:serine acetyltransferase